ncbi:MAG TPA: collagen-like protein [Puia sp.]|nr:collagen-like protein [Puia sp.]
MKKISLLSSLVALLLTVWSCKKGDTGPAGPAGPTGPTGPAGAPNVIYSDWFQASPWIKDTVFGIWGFNYTVTDARITQQILDSGTVITYGKLSGYNPQVWPTGQIAQLPISLTYISGTTMTDTWSAVATPGKIRIRFVNNLNYYTSIAANHTFRYIIIPGGVKGNGGRSMAPLREGGTQTNTVRPTEYNSKIDFTAMRYEELCDYLHIPR